MSQRRILFIDPFHGGSHAAFADTITTGIDADWTLATLPARHWKWRMRGAAMWLGERLDNRAFDLVVTTSFFPLAELRGLCPSLRDTPALLYFHENQLAYPVREEFAGERDFHFAFTQIAGAAASDACAFNSEFNRDSFLSGARQLLAQMPDSKPEHLLHRVAERSRVLPLPLDLDVEPVRPDLPADERRGGPIILWNHRWEHDKRPDRFFAALREMAARDVPFRLAVCGEEFRERPGEFEVARRALASRIVQFGFVESRERYRELLARAHVVVSTSDHEFFGMSVLEAVHAGARPLVPNRLAYRELFPEKFRYEDDTLVDRLIDLCVMWQQGGADLRQDRRELTEPFRKETVLPAYDAWFGEYMSTNTS